VVEESVKLNEGNMRLPSGCRIKLCEKNTLIIRWYISIGQLLSGGQ